MSGATSDFLKGLLKGCGVWPEHVQMVLKKVELVLSFARKQGRFGQVRSLSDKFEGASSSEARPLGASRGMRIVHRGDSKISKRPTAS